jgi:LiaI-LiaF-like transmembrane region
MSTQSKCHCQSCTTRALIGPAVLITIGVLFLLHQLQGGRFDFSRTFPVLLVVIGMLLLASSLAPRDGHLEYTRTATPLPPAVPPNTPPQAPISGQGR